MSNCSYGTNRHHLEGNVWAHTVLAYEKAVNLDLDITVKLAVLLHDIGRVYTRRVNKEGKISFGDFEGASIYVALDILDKFDLSEQQKEDILKIISYHYVIIDYIKFNKPTFESLQETFRFEEDILKRIFSYAYCDLNGRLLDPSIKHLYPTSTYKTFMEQIDFLELKQKDQKKKEFTLYILIGPPCSQKSTWSEKECQDAYIINRDSYVESIGKKYGKNSYDEAYDLVYSDDTIKKEVNDLETQRESLAVTLKQDVVIDNPNLKTKSRTYWVEKFSSTHNIEYVLFLTSYSNLLRCNKRRKKEIGKSNTQRGIVNKLKTFSYPLKNEGYDNLRTIFIV